jgi:energy-coupling factor transporter transmembrane protein EcfT
MVTTTLTLVVISHRLIKLPDNKRTSGTYKALKGIRWLIWEHLAITILIAVRVFLFALFCIFSESIDLKHWLIFDAVLIFFVICILINWIIYFHCYGGGNICKLFCGKHKFPEEI